MNTHINIDELRAQRAGPSVTVSIGDTAYPVRPLGVTALDAFITGRHHPSALVRYIRLRRFLRAAFGWQWRYLWRPGTDPVSQLMTRSAETRGRVVAALLQQAGHLPTFGDLTSAAESFLNG